EAALSDDADGVRAYKAPGRPADGLFQGDPRLRGDQVEDHLGAGLRLEDHAGLQELSPERPGVHHAAVVGQGQLAVAQEPHQRLRVGGRRRAPLRVAHVPHADPAGKTLQGSLVKHPGDRARPLVNPHGGAVEHGDPRALLSPVLQGVKTQVGQVGRLHGRRAVHAEDAAHSPAPPPAPRPGEAPSPSPAKKERASSQAARSSARDARITADRTAPAARTSARSSKPSCSGVTTPTRARGTPCLPAMASKAPASSGRVETTMREYASPKSSASNRASPSAGASASRSAETPSLPPRAASASATASPPSDASWADARIPAAAASRQASCTRRSRSRSSSGKGPFTTPCRDAR